ncbi:MAG TPA: nodulation protein NfeD [Steroidobacteraceae bacterium]|nr:nodulation protein NfeD [Steroidobacteraceae bacterium]
MATVIQLDGAIGPAMGRYVQTSLAQAEAQHDRLVILEMDTPGGLDTAMRDIIKAILAAPMPIVGYVAPSGARAASAGTYILYACTLAAMAPATNLGAATPISLGGESPSPIIPGAPTPPTSPAGQSSPAGQGSSTGQGGIAAAPAASAHAAAHARAGAHARAVAAAHAPHQAPASAASPAPPPASPAAPVPGTAEERKVVNDAVAYIRSLAQLRGRNADWAESAVRGAASLPAEDALREHVINLIAADVPDLLRQLDGRQVQVGGQSVVLHTADLSVRQITPDWRTRLLLVLSHPTIAYGLLLAGIWGLLLEGYHPGGVLPGVAGALALLLGLYGLELLAVNFAGLALMALGIGLIITEFFMPTYGSLGVGGLAAFVIGSIMLFAGGHSGSQVALPLIAGVAIAGALVVMAIIALAARARLRPVATGAEAMVGELVEVVSVHEGASAQCVVRYGGELWSARSTRPLRPGEQARIVRVTGLTLWVEPQPAELAGTAGAPSGLEPASGPGHNRIFHRDRGSA